MKRSYQRICSILFYTFLFTYLSLLLHALIFQRIHWPITARSVNLIPFDTIGDYVLELVHGSDSDRLAFDNLLFNILFFVPLGLYLPLFGADRNVMSCFKWILLFCVAVEVLQWSFRLGVADIDDVILNCLGGFLGLMMYKVLLTACKQKQKVRLCTTILSVAAGLPALYFAYDHILL